MNPLQLLFDMVEVIPPLALPYGARVFMSRAVQHYCDRVEAETANTSDRNGLTLHEDFAVSASVSLYLNNEYPAWIWRDDCLIHVTRYSTENGEVWLLLTRSDEPAGRLNNSCGKGGLE